MDSTIRVIYLPLLITYKPKTLITELLLESKVSPASILNHHAQRDILGKLRFLWPDMDELNTDDPLHLFHFSRYYDLHKFSQLKGKRERIAFLAEKSNSNLPDAWVGDMHLVIMIKGHDTFDFDYESDPVRNPYPAAFSLPPGPAYQFLPQDLLANGICESHAFSPIETEFITKTLLKKRKVHPKVIRRLMAGKLGKDTLQEFEADTNISVENTEGWHYSDTMKKLPSTKTYDEDRVMTMHGIFGHDFKCNLAPDENLLFLSGTKEWPGGKCLFIFFNGTFVKYSPKNDFALWHNGRPLILFEVCSNNKEPDFNRLLFEGASLVVYLNWVLNSGKSSPGFVLPLIYINSSYNAQIFLMREENQKVLYTHLRTCDLSEPRGMVQFMKFCYHMSDRRYEENSKLDEAWRVVVGLKSVQPSFLSQSASPRKSHQQPSSSVPVPPPSVTAYSTSSIPAAPVLAPPFVPIVPNPYSHLVQYATAPPPPMPPYMYGNFFGNNPSRLHNPSQYAGTSYTTSAQTLGAGHKRARSTDDEDEDDDDDRDR